MAMANFNRSKINLGGGTGRHAARTNPPYSDGQPYRASTVVETKTHRVIQNNARIINDREDYDKGYYDPDSQETPIGVAYMPDTQPSSAQRSNEYIHRRGSLKPARMSAHTAPYRHFQAASESVSAVAVKSKHPDRTHSKKKSKHLSAKAKHVKRSSSTTETSARGSVTRPSPHSQTKAAGSSKGSTDRPSPSVSARNSDTDDTSSDERLDDYTSSSSETQSDDDATLSDTSSDDSKQGPPVSAQALAIAIDQAASKPGRQAKKPAGRKSKRDNKKKRPGPQSEDEADETGLGSDYLLYYSQLPTLNVPATAVTWKHLIIAFERGLYSVGEELKSVPSESINSIKKCKMFIVTQLIAKNKHNEGLNRLLQAGKLAFFDLSLVLDGVSPFNRIHETQMIEVVRKSSPSDAPGSGPSGSQMPESTSVWLRSIGLGEYVDIFEKQGLGKIMDVLSVTDKDLKELDVKIGHRKIFNSQQSILKFKNDEISQNAKSRDVAEYDKARTETKEVKSEAKKYRLDLELAKSELLAIKAETEREAKKLEDAQKLKDAENRRKAQEQEHERQRQEPPRVAVNLQEQLPAVQADANLNNDVFV